MFAFTGAGLDWMLLHRCPLGGEIRQPIPLDQDAYCQPPAGCGARILPDQPLRAGHASITCPQCGAMVGICGALVLDQLEREAAGVIGA